MKKNNKIIVVVDPDGSMRKQLIARLATQMGFARTTSDALKIIRTTPYEYDLSTAYFVLAHSYDFRKSAITTQKLFELAARGLAVVIGVNKLPHEFEFCCEVYLKEHL